MNFVKYQVGAMGESPEGRCLARGQNVKTMGKTYLRISHEPP